MYIQAWKCIVFGLIWIPNLCIWEYFDHDLIVYSDITFIFQSFYAISLVILFIWTSIWSFADKHQTGRKILKRDYRKYPWNVVFRYESMDKELVDEITIEEPTTGGTYMFITETVQNGSKGASTRLLQKLLKAEGYFGANNKVITVDGDFGANTLYALKNYQRSNGLFADGICGPLTWAKIIGL